MEEEKVPAGEENQVSEQEEEQAKSLWQIEKESWYDKIPLNFKQIDWIVKICWLLIFVLIVVIALDAMDIFNPFGY